MFTVLANEHRRLILSYLAETDNDVTTFEDLVDHLLVHEAEAVDDLTDESVAIALHHIHLPKLKEAGLIEYDTQSETVRYQADDMVEASLNVTAIVDQE